MILLDSKNIKNCTNTTVGKEKIKMFMITIKYSSNQKVFLYQEYFLRTVLGRLRGNLYTNNYLETPTNSRTYPFLWIRWFLYHIYKLFVFILCTLVDLGLTHIKSISLMIV